MKTFKEFLSEDGIRHPKELLPVMTLVVLQVTLENQ